MSANACDDIQPSATAKRENSTWYRHKIKREVQKVRLHSNVVFKSEESKTSKLVSINNDQVKVYEPIQRDAFEAGSKHTRITYYVKKEAEVSGETYYLICMESIAYNMTIRWIHADVV